jgi:mechanosensitive ion channel-like protein
MIALNLQQGITDAWDRVATFVPKLLGFLVIVILGYLIAKLLARVVDSVLERIGFDVWVERGVLKQGLDRARIDASDVLATVTFWVVFLIALQLGFGVFGPNPISDLLTGLIAYLPNVFVAVVILVIAAALAKVVSDLLGAMLGSAPAGAWIARIAGIVILVFGVFAALNQLRIAPAIVNGLYYAVLFALVGAFVVAVGGGGIKTMQQYWERASTSVETKGGEIKASANPDAVRAKVSDMKEQMKTDSQPGSRVQ